MTKPTSGTFRSLLTFPVITLIRITGPVDSSWEFWGAYRTHEEAEADYRKRIKGHGITAWSWTGSVDQALQLLTDPHYEPAKSAESELRSACEAVLAWIDNMKTTSLRRRLRDQIRKALGRTSEP